MRINNNIPALKANVLLRKNNKQVSKSLERLSSGLKLNHASDNAAGMAISHKMKTQIGGINQASNNAYNGISVIQTAEGALNEIGVILSRMRELAVQASNDTYTDIDRETINEEITQLNEEIQRISNTTEFNTKKLLNGDIDNKVYVSNNNCEIISISDGVLPSEYKIEITKSQTEQGDEILNIESHKGFPDNTKFTIDGNKILITDNNNFKMNLDVNIEALRSEEALEGEEGEIDPITTISVLDAGPIKLQIGASENQDVSIGIPEISPKTLEIANINLGTNEGAQEAISLLDDAIIMVTSVRTKLGAYQNRLDQSINNLATTSLNMTEALSRIDDVDMAEEMAEYTAKNVLSQANTAILAQANERPQTILSLLQG